MYMHIKCLDSVGTTAPRHSLSLSQMLKGRDGRVLVDIDHTCARRYCLGNLVWMRAAVKPAVGVGRLSLVSLDDVSL